MCTCHRPTQHPTRAEKRGIGLPDELIALHKHHQGEQQREQAKAADLWRETGYVFTTPTGIAAIRRDVADKVGRLLWKPTEAASPDEGDDDHGDAAGAAGVPVPAA